MSKPVVLTATESSILLSALVNWGKKCLKVPKERSAEEFNLQVKEVTVSGRVLLRNLNCPVTGLKINRGEKAVIAQLIEKEGGAHGHRANFYFESESALRMVLSKGTVSEARAEFLRLKREAKAVPPAPPKRLERAFCVVLRCGNMFSPSEGMSPEEFATKRLCPDCEKKGVSGALKDGVERRCRACGCAFLPPKGDHMRSKCPRCRPED